MLEGTVQRAREAEQGQTGDWQTCLTGLRDGKGRAEPSPQGKGEKEKDALLGNILRGASSASLNGKLPATLGNTKGKWKELAHTTAALWKCLPRKAWDCVKILTDRSVRSDRRWSLDSQLQHFWCPLVGWTRTAHVPCWMESCGSTTTSACFTFPHVSCSVVGIVLFSGLCLALANATHGTFLLQQANSKCLSSLRSCLRSSLLFRVNGMFWDLWEATELSLLVENRERDVTVCKVVFWMP